MSDGLVVGVDPGTSGLGVAAVLNGTLLDARYISGEGGALHPLRETAYGFEQWLLAIADFGLPDLARIEIPQVYTAAQQKGDQRDLINLAVVAGQCLEVCGSVGVLAGSLVTPAQWKGQLPKGVMQDRLRKELGEQVDAIEFPKATSLHHNVWDAIGIAWGLR